MLSQLTSNSLNQLKFSRPLYRLVLQIPDDVVQTGDLKKCGKSTRQEEASHSDSFSRFSLQWRQLNTSVVNNQENLRNETEQEDVRTAVDYC